MFKIYESPQDPDVDNTPVIIKQDLKLCKKELTSLVDDIEFTRKSKGIDDDLHERLGYLYQELEDVVLMLKHAK